MILVKHAETPYYIFNGEEIAGNFYEKKFQETNQKEIRIEKVIKKKGNKLYESIQEFIW